MKRLATDILFMLLISVTFTAICLGITVAGLLAAKAINDLRLP